MGFIASTAFILATQGLVKNESNIRLDPPVALAVVPTKDRLDEIWGNVDNRVNEQIDVWFDDGEFPTIISLLKVQYAYSPDDYEVATNLGWMQENIELKNDAIATYTEYLNAHPKDGDAALPLAFLYYNMNKDYAKAVEILEPMLKYNPRPNTYRVLAKSYERLKKYSDAIRIWELELKRWPDEETAKANIRRVKQKLGIGG
ncbi:MAG: hypothetical protein GC165_05805 [Armatimonadetes bacterium]|nr:hypothetical protein [Armatimonadota bacterium]